MSATPQRKARTPLTPARRRLTLILTGIAAAGLALLAWTQPWFLLELDGAAPLTVAGQSAAPAISALGLASLALLGALSIAGRIVRIVLGVLETAIGVLIMITTVSTLVDPVSASAPAITKATAVSGPDSLAALVTQTAVTPWPWVAVLAGVLTAAVGVAVLVTSSRWPGPTRKYESAPSTDDTGTPVGAWDSLSGGNDPT